MDNYQNILKRLAKTLQWSTVALEFYSNSVLNFFSSIALNTSLSKIVKRRQIHWKRIKVVKQGEIVANVKLGGKFLFILILFFSYFYSPYNLKFVSKVHFIYILVLVSERRESHQVLDRKIIGWHWFWPQKSSILVLMSSIEFHSTRWVW